MEEGEGETEGGEALPFTAYEVVWSFKGLLTRSWGKSLPLRVQSDLISDSK
jgi:hypothetical protein